MLTEKDYCDYDTCVALKELGYIGTQGEGICFGAYYLNGNDIFYDRLCNPELGEDECLRVPLYLAQKWLRKEKKIDVFVRAGYLENNRVRHYYVEVFTPNDVIIVGNYVGDYDSYEEPLLEGIKEAIMILKEERK